MGKEERITEIFARRKETCLSELSDYNISCESDIVKEKITLVEEKIRDLPTSDINDEVVSRYLTLMKLSNELRS